MKKFKQKIIILILGYLILAAATFFMLNHLESGNNRIYRVEINDIMHILKENQEIRLENAADSIQEVDIKDIGKEFRYIRKVSYLNSSAGSEVINSFFEAENGLHFEIIPIVERENVAGYVRFDYEAVTDSTGYIIVSEAAILIMFAFTFSVLLFVYYGIVKPFNKFGSMPYELSRGNLTDTVPESRSRYFGKFVWGIVMLKDTLEEHKNKEMALAREKKLLVLSLSHDIKTPLNAINLYAKALETGIYSTQEQKQTAVVKIQEKCREINTFIQEIVKSQSEDVITIEVKNSEYYLNDLADKIYSGYAEKLHICKCDFCVGTYENRLLKGDIDRMYEAVVNLFENALKYGDGKRISLTFTEEENYVLIHVYNSGNPVPSREMPHLFDSFFRGSNVSGKQGNGLGLYICSEIMKKQGGEIYAQACEDGMEFVLVCQAV